MSWIAAGAASAAVIGGAIKGISGNQASQDAKGRIGNAFRIGQARTNLLQGDTRQAYGEGLTARGLAQGGGVTAGRPVESGAVRYEPKGAVTAEDYLMNTKHDTRSFDAPKYSGAHTLGEQGVTDLAAEQLLSQRADQSGYEADKEGINANNTQFQIGNVGSTIASAFQAYSAGRELDSLTSSRPTINGSVPKIGVTPGGSGGLGSSRPQPSPHWGGIDAVDPFRTGSAWASPSKANSSFNVTDDRKDNRP